jgi:hypothetical protein
MEVMPSKKKDKVDLSILTEEEAHILNTVVNYPHILGNIAGKDKLTALHSEWIKYIWDTDKDKALQAHRGSYKSTAVGAVGAVRWLLLHPDDRIAIVRKTFTDAADTVATIAKIMADPKIREIFRIAHREFPEFTVRRKEKIEFTFKKTKTNEGSVEAFGLDAAFTGRHFDRMLLDDVVTQKDRQSRAERERTKQIIYEIQTNIIDPGKPVSFIGTPWHAEDAWKVCPKPVKYSILDCNILSEEDIEEKRRKTTQSLFAANYLLEHVSDEGALFSNPTWGEWQNTGIETVYAHIDAAYDGDHFCALTIMAKRWDAKIQAIGFVYPGNIKEWAPEAVSIMRKYKVKKLYNESNPDKGYTADLFRILGMMVETYDENMNKHVKISTYLFEIWPDIVWAKETEEEYMAMIIDYMEGQTPDDSADSVASLCRQKYSKRGDARLSRYTW